MSTDRDKEKQNRDFDEKRQNQGQKHVPKASDQDKNQKISGNPERLKDNDHRMDQRANDVQGEVDYGENRHQPNEEANREVENRWKAIESDYRKRYPKITDEDVNYKSDDFNSMTKRIAKRTNRTPEEVHKEISNW
ncbi:hypothetical protein [Gelidibacter maritimus]|uniref:Uncharacterized protein n=1 Tax=Gelidibacter maritimus TaxID=2761487 RepID=A0A7W2R255_9FLAO|nr:hypothetical protein [Gelidibacter maritimus]MBA6151424.1 hypothetical protein [Gelidibacter maritimus]